MSRGPIEDRNNSTLEQVLAVTVKPGSRKGPLVETGDDGALTIYVPERAIEGKATAAAARLLAIIAAAAGLAFLIRGFVLKHPSPAAIGVIDGVSAIAMAVVVVGLMSAVGPAIREEPARLLLTLSVAFAGNFGLQLLMVLALRRRVADTAVAPLAIVAGNRNIALFLTALPVSVTDPLLLFIGCYQVPMYLTPILLGWLYKPRPASGATPDSPP